MGYGRDDVMETADAMTGDQDTRRYGETETVMMVAQLRVWIRGRRRYEGMGQGGNDR